MSSIPQIAAANITHAKAFVPVARRELETLGAQLVIWLGLKYGRVARFAPQPSGDAGTPTDLPFFLVLLVVCENWELHFAFDRDGEFEVCGPLEIGSTATGRLVPPDRGAAAACGIGCCQTYGPLSGLSSTSWKG